MPAGKPGLAKKLSIAPSRKEREKIKVDEEKEEAEALAEAEAAVEAPAEAETAAEVRPKTADPLLDFLPQLPRKQPSLLVDFDPPIRLFSRAIHACCCGSEGASLGQSCAA